VVTLGSLYIGAQGCVPVLLENFHGMSCSETCWPLACVPETPVAFEGEPNNSPKINPVLPKDWTDLARGEKIQNH